MDPGNEMGLAPCQIMEHSESKTPVQAEGHDSVSICVTHPGKPRSPDKPGWLAPECGGC